MGQAPSVTTWIGMLKTGDEEAAQRLWDRYFPQLLKLARRKMGHVGRQATDEEDVALSAFHTLCQAMAHERTPQLTDRDELWRTLVLITAGKVVDQRRRQASLKRGGEGIGTAAVPDERFVADQALLEQVVGSEPDPALAAEMADQCNRLLALLPDDQLRAMALFKLEGCSNEEIARRLKCSPRTVTRRLVVIRRTWQAEEC